ncbi:hypothetical protein SBF1_50116 [Candidatus Desulfosporosinus infrequens]|uniref:Uncharacterized protein n=1 Tax=Candidatus Desulfosporosinus infrequens TaxID=2043169 RepID=A0A2U3LH73_9FIRM|nr:hypothetical protein SBF1_50116 [Candidatus Desulfosporosinus infrequens]
MSMWGITDKDAKIIDTLIKVVIALGMIGGGATCYGIFRLVKWSMGL